MNSTQKQILRKLRNDHYIGKRHILNETLKHSLPRHQRGTIDNALKKLVQQGYIKAHHTGHGMSFAILPCRVAEIRKILDL